MIDLAEMAGVSLMTVHRSLNGYPDVKKETRDKILELARSSRYRPNGIARAMRSGKFGSIALTLGPADIELAAVMGIHKRLNAESMLLVLAEVPYDDEAHSGEIAKPRIFSESMIDGLIIHEGVLARRVVPEWIPGLDVPSVRICGDGKYNCIGFEYGGVLPGRLDELFSRGYEKVIYLGPTEAPRHHFATPAAEVFLSWAGKGDERIMISTDIRIAPDLWAEELRRELKGCKSSAVFAPLLPEARRAYHIGREMGLSVPSELGIMLVASRTETTDSGLALSGLRYSSHDLGEAAAGLLLNRIVNDGADFPSVRVEFDWHEGATLKSL